MEKKAPRKNKVRRFYFVKINPLLDFIHQHESDLAPISDEINLNWARQRETFKRLDRLRGEQLRINEDSSSRKNIIEEVETLDSGSAAKLIHKLRGRECRDLATERKILREMKGLEERNENGRTNAAKKRQIRDSLKSGKSIHEQIEHINRMRDAVEKERAAISDAQNQLYNKSREINGKLEEVKRCIYHIERRLVDVDGSHYDHLRMMLRVRELAKKKDVAALEQLSFTQMEVFMCHWSSTSGSLRKLYEGSRLREQVMSPSSWLLNLKQLHNCPSTPSPSWFSPSSLLPPELPPDVDVYKVNVAVAWHPRLKSAASTGIVCRDSLGLVTFVVSLGPYSYPKDYGVNVHREETLAIYWGIREAKRHALPSVHLELELDSQNLVDLLNHYHIPPLHYYSDPTIRCLATSFTYFSISFVHKSSISTARFLAQRALSWPGMYAVWGTTCYPLWLSQAFSFDQ